MDRKTQIIFCCRRTEDWDKKKGIGNRCSSWEIYTIQWRGWTREVRGSPLFQSGSHSTERTPVEERARFSKWSRSLNPGGPQGSNTTCSFGFLTVVSRMLTRHQHGPRAPAVVGIAPVCWPEAAGRRGRGGEDNTPAWSERRSLYEVRKGERERERNQSETAKGGIFMHERKGGERSGAFSVG